MTDTPHYHGHRQRLRDKLLHGPADGLADYELLEIVLFGAYPRKDVKAKAKKLLEEHGSLNHILAADYRHLSTLLNDQAIALLHVSKTIIERSLQASLIDQPVLKSWKSLLDYCRLAMGQQRTEQCRVLYLNTQLCLIADEIQSQGSLDQTALYPREVIKRALECDASGLILVHNHPSGQLEPSTADISLTKNLQQAALLVEMQLHDHVIVSAHGYYSFKAHGLL